MPAMTERQFESKSNIVRFLQITRHDGSWRQNSFCRYVFVECPSMRACQIFCVSGLADISFRLVGHFVFKHHSKLIESCLPPQHSFVGDLTGVMSVGRGHIIDFKFIRKNLLRLVRPRTRSGPTFECASKGARVRKPKQVRRLIDGRFISVQEIKRHFASQFI